MTETTSLPIQFDAVVNPVPVVRFVMDGQAFGWHPVIPPTDTIPMYRTGVANG